MGFNSLKDLELAGVKWELKNEFAEPRAQNGDVNSCKSSSLWALQTTNLNAIAPVAPSAAESLAGKVADFDTLNAAIAEFNHPLKMFAKNTVPPTNRNPKLLVITDAPSSDDDETGTILSGAAGELFDKMIGAIGLSREDIAICPLVFWRPPGGRTSTDEELSLARPFVDKFIELLQPDMVLALGTSAIKYESQTMISKPGFSIPHPRDLLLKQDLKKNAWDTLQKLKNALDSSC